MFTLPRALAPVEMQILHGCADPQPRISKDATEKLVVRTVAYSRSGMDGYELRDHLSQQPAIGAIGVGRTFAYGGNKNQPMYAPELVVKLHSSFDEYATRKTSTINHFHEKFLLLADRLNTDTAKKIGRERHQFMEDFLTQFYAEWNFQPES